MDRILAGDPAGLNRLLGAHGQELADYVRVMVGEDMHQFPMVMEDVLVDILKRARGAADRRNGSFRRFLFESASRTMRKRHEWIFSRTRTGRSSRVGLRETARIEAPGTAALLEAARGLSPDERELLALRHRFGFSYDDISDIRSEARVNFEDRLTAAREHFRARLLPLAGGRAPAELNGNGKPGPQA